MRKWLYAASLILALATSTVVQAADKMAVVNVSSIFHQSPQRTVVAKQLENEFKSRATELQSLERDLQTKTQRLQRDGSTMQASERYRRSASKGSVCYFYCYEPKRKHSIAAQVYQPDPLRRACYKQWADCICSHMQPRSMPA